MSDPFVTTAWLAEHLADPNLVVVDGSWYLPAANRDPNAEYRAGHIPGAVFWDLDEFSDNATGLPHMLLPPEEFAEVAGNLGIAETMTIVVYDGDGLFSAPRVRWQFTTMGATNAVILEGGLPKWKAERWALESGETKRAPVTFTATFDPKEVADIDMVRRWIDDGGRQIADARPALRFTGDAPEPRPGIRGGHMPGAFSAPGPTLTENGLLKSAEQLRAQFTAAGLDVDKPVVTSCGSGVVAATLKLALERAGAKDVVLYDGSWTEWGGREDTAVVKGA